MWSETSLDDLKLAADGFHKTTATDLVEAFVEFVNQGGRPEHSVQKGVFQQLRRARWFDLMQSTGEALLVRGVASALARRQYGQSLIERGAFDDALRVLSALVADGSSPEGERTEARGLVGRVYKQLYVDKFAELGPARGPTLQASVAAYYEAYKLDRAANTWHGINAVAMLARGARDGITVDVGETPEEIAKAIVAEISSRGESLPHWDLATAAEAHVALQQWDRAYGYIESYVQHPDLDAFSAASTLRQLKQVWQITEDDPGGVLVTILQLAVMSAAQNKTGTLPERIGARLSLSVGELDAAFDHATAREDTLEKVFGKQGPRSLDWYRLGIVRARAVARIEHLSGDKYGTGFLVPASTLFPGVGGSKEKVLVTNAHVLGTTDPGALSPESAVAYFEAIDNQRTFRVREVLFESPPDELDVTVVRLDGAVVGVDPYTLAPDREPDFDPAAPRQFYVIGHPLGGRLSVSIDDNFQVGWATPKLHYRTPTQPGSSGSPVFDDAWNLIAVHHAGSVAMKRLDGKPGHYEANEGIWIHSVVDAIAKSKNATTTSFEQTSPAVSPAFRRSIFISYAHADAEWLERLTLLLQPVTQNLQFDIWDDRKLAVGSPWRSQVQRQLDDAKVAILLVSANFLASDFITTEEFPKILQASQKRGLTIVPVAVGSGLYESVELLAALQFANDRKKPLSVLTSAEQETTLTQVAQRISHILELSALSNPLKAIDAATFRSTGLGGTTEADAGLRGLSGVASQVGEAVVLNTGRQSSREVLSWAQVEQLPEQERQYIRTMDRSIQESFDRWTEAWPKRHAQDPDLQRRIQDQLNEARSTLCNDFRRLLEFFDRCGWLLDDHYYAVRDICDRERPTSARLTS